MSALSSVGFAIGALALCGDPHWVRRARNDEY